MNGWSGAAFFDALTFSAGHNAAVVAAGAALLGAAAGSAGVFLFLRKRALLSDAVAHATLPGVALAFIFMASIGGDGRSLPGLLIGAAVTAALGLAAVSWMTRRTRLGEDAAIGAVLSVFYGLGVVLLTVIQTLGVGKPAGLETFLLGATAGMLYAEALLIAVAAALALGVVAVLRRPLAVSAFDPGYAASIGVDIRRVDLALMALVTAVVVIGLKIVGLIMVIALLIIPPVAARFWTERSDRMIWIAAVVGALSGVLGAAASAAAPSAPTGPLIVLICFAFFA
ncbi:MAG: metal ABC transporter permease, partial [Pseudomonadota bacterium]